MKDVEEKKTAEAFEIRAVPFFKCDITFGEG
jgi:hypothetical protein